MLTKDDVSWIAGNRAEITEQRTEPITIIHRAENGQDPYTKEPIWSETPETVDVVWREVSSVTRTERAVAEGIELRVGDVFVSFEPTVILVDVVEIVREGESFELVSADEKGIGGRNRFEAIVRRRT